MLLSVGFGALSKMSAERKNSIIDNNLILVGYANCLAFGFRAVFAAVFSEVDHDPWVSSVMEYSGGIATLICLPAWFYLLSVRYPARPCLFLP